MEDCSLDVKLLIILPRNLFGGKQFRRLSQKAVQANFDSVKRKNCQFRNDLSSESCFFSVFQYVDIYKTVKRSVCKNYWSRKHVRDIS